MFFVDEVRCTGCENCLDICPRGAIQPTNGAVSIDQKRCDGCGACVDVCPAGAIREVIPQQKATTAPPDYLTGLPLPAMSERAILPPRLGRASGGRRRRRGRRWRI